MSYVGKTFQIPCNRGGFYYSKNVDTIPPAMMIGLTKNLNLNHDGRETRGGTDIALTGYGGAQIMGGFDFTLRNGTQFNVVATADGKIWKNATTTIKTGLASNVYVSFCVYNNKLYICNGDNIPQVWDGAAASTSNLALMPADWTGSNYPVQMIVHGRGASERLWAIGAVPNIVYASALNDGTSDADFFNVITIQIETGDGFGITGGVEYGDRLFVFSNRRAFIIDDEDASAANWGYQNAQWSGGAAHHRLIVKTPNDLVCMMDDGEIYSVNTAMQYGDYQQASIARPAFIDRWLRENSNLSKINNFHAVYDPELRLMKFFLVRAGKTTVDTALIYYLNKALTHGPSEAWMIHDNQTYNSGYSASASWNFRLEPPEDHRDYIYTGDYSGNVWDLEEIDENDNDNAYTVVMETPDMSFENPRVNKHFKRGWLIAESSGDYSVNLTTYVDGTAISTNSISLSGGGVFLNDFQLDDDYLAVREVLNIPFDIGTTGNRIRFKVVNNNANQAFFISQILVDYKPLGNRPS